MAVSVPTSTPSGYSQAGVGGGGGGNAGGEDEGYALDELRKRYLEFASAKNAELTEQREARHYYHGDQLTEAEIATLKKRRQPVHIDNQIGPLIDGVVGLIERLRQDPKAYPRTPQEEGGAEIATSTLKYAFDAADWKQVSPEAARTGAINGFGGVELLITQGDHGDPEIDLGEIDAETFFYDPRSKRHDFSDARFMGVAKWLDLDVAKEMFPDKAEDLDGLVQSGGDWGSLAQRDMEQQWLNTSTKQIFVVEHWYIKGGTWRYCFYTGATELKKGVSPFIDEKGKTFCKFLPWSAYVDHDGDRYGMPRNMKSAQDEINTFHIKARHTLNNRRVIYEDGAVDDIEIARVEVARPDGAVKVNPGRKFELDDSAKYADLQGQLGMLQGAYKNIQDRAPNAALIGQGLENQSGRAIALLQQAGLAKLGPLLINYRAWKIRVYRAVWNAIRRFWTAERWVRVTDDEGAPQFIGINRVQMGPMGPQMVNRVAALDVDIIIDEGPDSINMMADTLDALERVAASSGSPLMFRMVIEMSPLTGSIKKRMIDMIEKAQQPDPQKEALQQAGAVAEVRKTNSEATLNEARAGSEKVNAVTKIVDAIHPPLQSPRPMLAGPQKPQAQQPGIPAMLGA